MLSFQTHWWQRFPDVFKRERQGFAASDMEVEFDETSRYGQMAARVLYRSGVREIRLEVVYPHLYPEFKPEIFAEGEAFSIHQNPGDNRLCMTGDRSAEWYDFETAADLIMRQMPELLSDNDNQVGYRDGQAAPISGFFNYHPFSTVIVDGAWLLPGGVFDATVNARIVLGNNGGIEWVRGIVSQIKKPRSRMTFRKIDDRLRDAPCYPTSFHCPLLVIPKPVFICDPGEQLKAIGTLHPGALERHWVEFVNGPQKRKVCVVGICFKEEVAPGKTGHGYQFFVIDKTPNGENVYRIRAQRGGVDDIGSRVPQVQGLRRKTITLNGAGAIGSPAVLEFARNGVRQLRINDYDYFDIATSPRWALGLPSVGGAKSLELKSFIDLHYPRTEVLPFALNIGFADVNIGTEPYLQMMTDLLEGTGAIVDFSAEIGVQNFLQGVANELEVPFIFASATNGAAGGLVGRFMPGSHHGCWYCLQCALHADAEDSVQHIPSPEIKDDGDVFPAGCTHPTFTGAGFDLQEVTMHAVRMTTQALLDDNADSLIARLGFSGKSRTPVWEEFEVIPRAECAICSGKIASKNITGT